MKKILLSFGTRPEAIKMAPLYHSLKSFPNEFEVSVSVSAQHREMLDQVLEIFNIVPDYDLNIMSPGQDLFDITDKTLLGMRGVLNHLKPNILLVHGDTTTALVSSLAGYYAKVPMIGHVEAGLRTRDIQSPFPEELNRQLISRMAGLHFAPTRRSYQNLIDEGISHDNICITGNTVIDAMKFILNKIDSIQEFKKSLELQLSTQISFDFNCENFILITGHRRENFGPGFIEICNAIKELANKYSDFHFLYPVHLNPNVQGPVKTILDSLINVHLIAPLKYDSFMYLISKCYLVLTDSGGIQEEAPSLGKPVLVMREITERPEGVDAGTVILVGSSRKAIVAGVSRLLDDSLSYDLMSKKVNPYGDGNTCHRIIKKIREFV